MNLALVGAHRTGKSTLARAFAQKHDIPFVQTGATEVFKALGLDPKAEYPIAERIAIQAAILSAFEAQWLDAMARSTFFISDRSPIDLASYLLADVTRQTLTGQPEVAKAVNYYVKRCIESANRFFATIVLVQPGIALVEEEGKAPACPAYMEHLNALQLGLLTDSRLESRNYSIRRGYLDLDVRIQCLENCLRAAQDKHYQVIGKRIEEGSIALH
ncbi:AAA family ATPase [Variovorax paradoxus]|uniref:AAA family ATPase n=1 Tax=Variovorax paradoxus TaxID=34073 RepID=A0A5Q0M7R3_VARPD|nr:AAA family ATPase [Variovorax paradoxus]QFZ84545.1 AAA family ATPase [Variovorax paradoxus]